MYGSHQNYYGRQLSRLLEISQAQAKVKNDSGEAVGDLYKIHESIEWLKKNLVCDELSIVHGDYKPDNIVISFDFFI